MKSIGLAGLGLAGLLSAGLTLSCGGGDGPKPAPEPEAPPALTTLEQGWDEAAMHGFWFTPQGSRLVPYDWFLGLEQKGSDELFRSNENLDRLRFIPAAAGPYNPDGLPIGFTKEPAEGDGPAYLGMTCAACHTGRIDYDDVHLVIDGGPALHDFNTFLDELLAAMQATLADEGKLDRLAKRLGASDPAALRESLGEATDALADRLTLNKPDHPAGFARVDAFGNIFNEVSTAFLGVPENGMPPNAPVSYPPLWDTPQHDRVQWNGSAINAGAGPLVRNAGEVMGVFGSLDFAPLPDNGGYSSTIRTANLAQLEDWITTLESPQWPAALPAIDAAKAEAGAAIYERTCVNCHPKIERADPARTVKATMVPLATVGTDPEMARQFGRISKTGSLEGRPAAFVAGAPLPAQAPTGFLVVNGVIGSLVGRPVEGLPDLLKAYFGARAQQPANEPPSYKARPLNGVWATAPYLHNGSAPTLRAMLTPPAERPKTFRLGSREYDPAAVGYKDGGSFVYDTALPGNSNLGHPFGTDLDEDSKGQLIEYLKSL
ncbi:MAG: hypothetical protein GC160_20705 [Acidobacteria bacterium]|nr:hypothetical protein [Acidobacteriota bacterium]